MLSALDFEELSTFQLLLYTYARTVARMGLFMKRHIKYVLSEGCGLESQRHFQVENNLNSDWMGQVFQLQFSYLKLIRRVCVCVCVCVCQTIQRYRHVVYIVLKTAEYNI